VSLPPLPRKVAEEVGIEVEEEEEKAEEEEEDGVVVGEIEDEEVVVARVSRCSSRRMRISRRRLSTISSTNRASSVEESRCRAICATRAISSLFDFI
jgi:hypothetical protein